MQQIKVG